MRVDYNVPIQVVVESIRHFYHINLESELMDGVDFFPSVKSDGGFFKTSHVLRFNPKVQTILALYNLSMQHKINTGDVIIHFVLFHAFLDVDDYAGASRYLASFRQQLTHILNLFSSSEEKEEQNAQLLMQLYFILFHEAFHIILHHHADTYKEVIEITHELLRDIASVLDDMHESISNDKLMNHPRILQRIEALIPDEISIKKRQEMEIEIKKHLTQGYLNSSYISQVLKTDPTIVEEITCDRLAWLNMLSFLKDVGLSDDDILSIHLCMFIVLNAMDFNKILLFQFIPVYHDHGQYDPYRVLLRQKAFKTLLRHYHGEIDRTITTEYTDLHKGLESIFRSSVKSIDQYRDDLQHIYLCHQTGNHQPDFSLHRRLEEEMAKVVSLL